MTDHRDYIIAGQGIAGSVLAMKLLKRGRRIAVFDKAGENISSSVAAGIFNPITGRNMIKTWKAEALWDDMFSFYREVEKILGISCFHELPHYRPFRSTSEINEMTGRSAEDGYSEFIGSIEHKTQFEYVLDPYGGVFLQRSGYLDINVFTQAVRTELIRTDSYFNEKIETGRLDIGSSIRYGNLSADRIVFCDGWRPEGNPLFPWLPYRPVKGELLHINSGTNFDAIINRGVFLLPRKDGKTIIGSTYESEDLSLKPTEKGREYLERKLMELIDTPFEIVDQTVGIRPSTLDRRPFVGIHPEIETVATLNGLGTKGVSLAPHFADELISFIEEEVKIDREADIKRYY